MSEVQISESTDSKFSRKYDPLQVQGDYNAQGPREYQHALGRQRTNAKGHQSQTEDEKEDLSSS